MQKEAWMLLEKGSKDSGKDAASASQSSIPSINLPKGGGAIRGIGEKFAANPVTGTGSMSVPVATSPGRSGFGPQLSLSYDSGGGNGPFGFGWTLSLPSITRKTDKGLPKYQDADESDVFMLSGAEDLVPVLVDKGGGKWEREQIPPCTVGGKSYRIQRYRPRIEGLFARIERWTDLKTREIHWRSISKDNITTLYGRDNNSRISDPSDACPEHPARIFSWLICQSYDDKGNAIVYEYAAENDKNVDCSQANERNRVRTANRYLKRIKYGNRTPNRDLTTWQSTDPSQLPDDTWMFEVVFDYGEGHYAGEAPNGQAQVFAQAWIDPPAGSHWPIRQDPFSTFRAGFEVRTYRLCRRVLMFHHFPQELGIQDCLVRSTEFSFAESPIASFITSVTQSGYVRKPTQNIPNRYLKKSLPSLEFEYSQVPGPEQLARQPIREVDAESLENLPVGLDGTGYQWMDLDGEGTFGILSEQADGWYYKRNLSANNQVREDGHQRTVARFGPIELVTGKPAMSLAGGAQFLDLAGDGQTDLVQMEGAVRGFYERTEDAGWAPFRPFVSWPNLNTRDPDLKFVDLTGDGHADILITEGEALTWYPSLAEEGFGPAVRVSLPVDEEKGPRLVFADGTQSVYLADLSGDGLSDLVRIRNGEVCYWPNVGYGRFGAKVTMDNAPWFDSPDQFDQRRIRLADSDGSGTTDILYLRRDGVQVYFNQSGNRWSDAVALPQFPPIDNISSVQTLDLLGNGTACLVWSSPLPGAAGRPMRYLALMEDKPHLLVRVKNNLGAETKVHYAPSTKFYLQDKQDGKPWITRLPFPVHVVERVETYDRISRNRFVTRYSYHHGYFDGVEREFRGFSRVDQWDTEEIGVFEDKGLVKDADNIDEASHVPPVLTRTWFHTGIFLGRDKVSNYFAGLLDVNDKGEYYREPGPQDQTAKELLLDDSALPADLTVEEEREACRALKGSMLRQEVYALDGSETADYPYGHPYTVTEQNFTVRRLQLRAENRQAVFFTHHCEVLNYHYERDPSDPRVQHTLTLEVDDYGNALKSVAINYGRRQGRSTLQGEDKKKQEQTLITYTENDLTNAIDKPVNDPEYDPDNYRAPLPCETRTYELTGLATENGAQRFSLNELSNNNVNKILNLTEVPYQQAVDYVVKCKRLIEHVCTLYRPNDCGTSKNDMMALLPLRALESMALPGESYKLAFTPELAKQIYVDSGRISQVDLNKIFADECRYVHSEGDGNWWIPSGRVYYSSDKKHTAAQELAFAKSHFFLPHRFSDPFENTTIIKYDDPHNLLIVKTTDPLDNAVQAQNDYRVLHPKIVTDPNDNRTEAAFDALGMVVGTAVMGKTGENKGDLLDNTFKADLTDQEMKDFYNYPKGKASLLLGNATTRIIYDLDIYRSSGKPIHAATLARETHFHDPPPPGGLKIQISFSYSDGFGREIQKKVQAEPGKVDVEDADGNLTSVDTTPNIRWVGSGWTIFNNKGKSVRQYEPFFSVDHYFQFGKKVGVSPTLFYDPLERVVATLHPNHTWEKVVFDPWQQEKWDVNDAVTCNPQNDEDVKWFFLKPDGSPRLPTADYLPTWYESRNGGLLGAAEQSAAQKAAKHAETPTVIHLDTLGRTFLTIADNGAKGKYPTHLELDIEGNQREVIDAKDRVVMRYDYHIAGPEEGKENAEGHPIHQISMDAGERWMLYDVLGHPVRTWDSRNHEFSFIYDELRRPTEKWVKGGDGQAPLDNLYEKIIYGEDKVLSGLTDKSLNLRGKPFVHYDTAGRIQFEGYDFKGNLLKNHRCLAQDYNTVVHWSVADPEPLLEKEFYSSETEYDALNRITKSRTPDNSITTHVYNEANMLDKVFVLMEDGTQTQFVENIEYNEKGQRAEITYGNKIKTTYEYDKVTFRLSHLQTKKANGKLLQDLYYAYDPTGNITQIKDNARPTIFFNNFEIKPVNEFTYDAIYRLTEAKGREHIAQVGFGKEDNWNDLPFVKQYSPGDPMIWRDYTQNYQYDPVGNIEQIEHMANGGSWKRIYDYEVANNRLKSATVGNETYSYTHHTTHGFMTTMPHLQRMEWNFKEELHASAKQKVNNGTPETTYYVYDFDGQRVRKITENAADLNSNPSPKEERIYVGGIEIYKKLSGNHVGLERKTMHVMDDKSRIAMVETRNKVDDGSPKRLIRYQFSNHLGTACLETDNSADPRVISYEEYHPYGTTSYQAVDNDIKAAAKRYRYTGKERDEESGLYYHGARYYAAWLRRWIACDPEGQVDGCNLYAFVRGNPVLFTDQTGRYVNPERIAGTKDLQEQFKRSLAASGMTEQAWKKLPLEKQLQFLSKSVFNPGGKDDATNRFVYTRLGWIDVGHFFALTLYTHTLKTRTHSLTDKWISKVYQISGLQANDSYLAFSLSYAIEAHQFATKMLGDSSAWRKFHAWLRPRLPRSTPDWVREGGWGWDPKHMEKMGWATSAFTYEDLFSNFLGTYFANRVIGPGKDPFAQFISLLQSIDAVNPRERLPGGRTARELLRADVDYLNRGAVTRNLDPRSWAKDPSYSFVPRPAIGRSHALIYDPKREHSQSPPSGLQHEEIRQ
jgi:RHS repeat-associated protein